MHRANISSRPGGPTGNSPGRKAGVFGRNAPAKARRADTPSFGFRTTLAATILVLSTVVAPSALGQRKILAPPASGAVPSTKPRAEIDPDKDPAAELAEKTFPGGAALKTDPEQQRLLRRAEQCVEDGRLDLAAVLWQKVLDEAGDTLMTRDGRTYTSLAEQVERTLAKLPPLALATYRTSADAEAQALLAGAGTTGEEEALAAVVRRYFLSSVGDDAAYKLACLALDRYDFVGASRLLNKILESHPDPSIPRSEILLRLAVASARMGDRTTADQSLTKFETSVGPRPASDIVDLITADVRTSAAALSAVGPAAKDWRMILGNPSRTGFMTSLPAAVTSRTLSELWVREDPVAMSSVPGQQNYAGGGVFMGGVVVMRGGMMVSQNGQVQQTAAVSREELINNWRSGGWRPTGRLLFDGGRVYLKTPDRLVCFSGAAHNQQPIWQSAWENRYELDGMSQMLTQMQIAYGNVPQGGGTSRPKSAPEVLLFGDRVHQSMSIDGGAIYTLEGKRVGTERPAQQPARGFQYGVTPRRTRGNWLTAYQASGGKALWTRTASDEDKEGTTDVGFLAAPVPCGSLLLAPVTDGGTIWLLGLERATGKTLWRSYLCDEPQGGASPWAEVVLAVEGREAYITCGCGVVFAVDAVGGTIRWAVRYERDGKPNMTMRNYGVGQNLLDLSGWDDDVVIPHGRYLIVMSSDNDKILGLDRRTGAAVWHANRISPFGGVAQYCLGVQGDRLYVAGKNVVRCHNIKGQGLLVWEKTWDKEESFGRGCITDDALYIPVKDSILKLDPKTGNELSQVGVALTSDEPVGNLFSDGEKLWAVGAGRVYAMTTLEHRMKILEQQIVAGDGEAQLNRMRLYFKQNRTEQGLADLRAAYVLFQAKFSPDESALRLFAAINELKLTQRQPLVTLQLLTDLFVNAASQPELTKEALSRRADIVAGTVSVIRQQKTPGALPLILAAAPLLTEEYLLSAATFAVDSAATKEDSAALLEAVQKGSPQAQLLAIRAAARLAPDDARPVMAKLLPAGDERVRLAAARALANLGERKDVLETFVALLDSPTARIRSRSQQSLRGLTEQNINFPPEGKPEDRAVGITKWKEWLAGNSEAKLKLPLLEQAVPLGRTLFVSQGQGTVLELDADNKERWRQTLPGPAWGCQGLPNGHRLVAVYSHSLVIEYDDSGKEIWRKDRLPGPPYSVQRLDNGNTLVACADVNQLVEIAPDGSTTTISVQGRPMSAQRLENGNTLVALQQGNRVVEVDRAGKVVWEARTMNPPGHAVRLENGNTLVCLTYGRQVVEYDPAGKNVVWKTSVSLTNPYVAQRLPSGNTLVADHVGLHEIDAGGSQDRRQIRHPQVTGLSSY